MSSLIFKLETLNPKLRTTFFKHKNYTNYLANSEYAIKNPNVNHGLFGIVKQFPNIENMKSIEKVSDHITNLADNEVPIYRGVISLKEYDASRLGYLEQEKWKELLESKLPSIARKLKIRYQDIQYVGAVHLENGHPHLQFMLWSKSRDKSNYYVKADIKDKLRKEFTNAVFIEDLLPIYKPTIIGVLMEIKQDILKEVYSQYKDLESRVNKFNNENEIVRASKKGLSIFDNNYTDGIEADSRILETISENHRTLKYMLFYDYTTLIVNFSSNKAILQTSFKIIYFCSFLCYN